MHLFLCSSNFLATAKILTRYRRSEEISQVCCCQKSSTSVNSGLDRNGREVPDRLDCFDSRVKTTGWSFYSAVTPNGQSDLGIIDGLINSDHLRLELLLIFSHPGDLGVSLDDRRDAVVVDMHCAAQHSLHTDDT